MNNLHSNNRRVVVLPLRWETHTSPEYNVRPQEVINKQIVDECDVVIGVFWTRLGTPTGEADSGTIEEIERVAKAGKPVMLYFSHKPLDPNEIDREQMESVRRFRERIKGNALIETFNSALEFRDKLWNQLERKVRDLQSAEAEEQPAPLSLEIISPETGEPFSGRPSAIVDRLQVTGDEHAIPDGLREYVERVAKTLRAEALLVPLVLAIRNVSSAGIRNVFIELSLRSDPTGVTVSATHPSKSIYSSSLLSTWLIEQQPSELERKLAKLPGEGVRRDGDSWHYSFEIDAIQPVRLRLLRPFFYLHAPGACSVEIRTKVYADTFPKPITMLATLEVREQPRDVAVAEVVEKAEEIRKQEKSSGSFSSSFFKVTNS